MGSLPAKAGASLVVIDPKQPERVYAAGTSGLYRSDDAGQTWRPMSQGLPSDGVTALALDPRSPDRLYAAMGNGTLWLSTDGATSWRALPGGAADAHAPDAPGPSA